MPNTPTTNFAYNKPATGDSGWGDTWNDNLDDFDSDFSAEHRFSTGNRGKHGPKVTIDQTSANNALVIDHSPPSAVIAIDINRTTTFGGNIIDVLNSGTGTALQITQAGAAASVTIDQNGASTAINVTQNATNNKTLFLRKTGTGAGAVLDIDNTGTGSGINVGQVGEGDGIYVLQSGESRAIYVEKSAAGASRAMVIDNSGTGQGLNILQKANGIALDIDKTNTGGANVIDLDNSGSGADIDGHGSLWQVSPNGQARFARTASRVKEAFSEENTFSSIQRWDQIAMSSAQGGTALDDAFAGFAFDGRYVYFTSTNSDTFVSYDTTQAFTSIDAWEQIAMSSAQGNTALDGAYAAGVIFDGRFIYFTPVNSDTFIRHDTARPFTAISSWQQIGMNSAQGNTVLDGGYSGAAFDGRYVYFGAFSSDTFIRYDTAASFTAIASWAQMPMSSAQGAVALDQAYQGAAFDGRYVYYVPRTSVTMIRYDTTASFTAIASWEQIAFSSAVGGASPGSEAFAGATFDGRYVYYCAVNSDTFVRFDTTLSFTAIASWQQIGMNSASTATGDTGFNGCTCDGRFVYFMPSNHNTMMRFDVTQPFTSISSWVQVATSSAIGGANSGGAMSGGGFDGYYVYYSPRHSDSFVRFRSNNATTSGPTEYAQASS